MNVDDTFEIAKEPFTWPFTLGDAARSMVRRKSFGDVVMGMAHIEHEPDAYAAVQSWLHVEPGMIRPSVFFIGNGGSAAIASHMAIDWMKNGRIRAMAFNDPAALTCLSNDIGYENVFTYPLSFHAQDGDILFAISSSGESESILNAVSNHGGHKMRVVTLSGFEPNNGLRHRGGDINFYVPSSKYGTVEICHLAILHSILDEWIDAKGY